MLFMPSDHATNGPETWKVVRISKRRWGLADKSGHVMQGFDTKRDAEQGKSSGHHYDLYIKEGRWIAGEMVSNWKPFSACFNADLTPIR